MEGHSVSQMQMIPVMTAALRACRPKALKRGFGNDKVTSEELTTFENCVSKYFQMSSYAEAGTKDGLQTL